MLELKGIEKRYDSGFLLAVPQLHIQEGSIYGLLGTNGAGKTTMIRMILGLLKPTKGAVYIDEENVLSNAQVKRKLGYIPDVPNLYEELTGYEHVEFIARLYNMYDKEKIDQYFKYFEMWNYKDKLISTYSKGMKQKVSIISALIHNPKVLILDEPFTGLDPLAIMKVKDILKKFVEMEGNVVIFSTHDLDVADNLCNQAILLDKGKIMCNITEQELRREGLEKIFMNRFAGQKVEE